MLKVSINYINRKLEYWSENNLFRCLCFSDLHKIFRQPYLHTKDHDHNLNLDIYYDHKFYLPENNLFESPSLSDLYQIFRKSHISGKDNDHDHDHYHTWNKYFCFWHPEKYTTGFCEICTLWQYDLWKIKQYWVSVAWILHVYLWKSYLISCKPLNSLNFTT